MNYSLSSLEAFTAMKLFLKEYYDETLSDDLGVMLGELQFFQPDTTADPAAWYNWEKFVNKIASKNDELTAVEIFKVIRLFLEKYVEETSSQDIAAILKDIEILSNGIIEDSNINKKWIFAIQQTKNKINLYD